MGHAHLTRNESLDSKIASVILIHISDQYAEALISQLVSKQISFQVFYQPSTVAIEHIDNIMDKRKSSNSPFYPVSFSSQEEQVKIENIYIQYIENFPQKLSPNEETIAFSIGMTVSHFRTIFKNTYGQSFCHKYLEKRMEYAKHLLCKGFNCSEVSTAIGYGKNSAIKFNKMFQKHFGITPKKYQLQHAS